MYMYIYIYIHIIYGRCNIHITKRNQYLDFDSELSIPRRKLLKLSTRRAAMPVLRPTGWCADAAGAVVAVAMD